MFTQAREPGSDGAMPLLFDGVVFHPASGRLEGSGWACILRPRTAAVLEYLLRHPDRLVAKDELLDQVWSEAVVTEDSLTQCIKEIRKALTPDHRHAVRTVPRVGYQIAVPVHLAPAREVAPRPPAPEVVANAPDQASGWLVSLGALLTVGLLVGLMGMALVRDARPTPRPPLSILVFPFTQGQPNGAAPWLGEVLSNELTIRLGQTAGTQVISADTARAMRASHSDPRAAAAALGVRYVLTGRVQQTSQSVGLNLVLTDSDSGLQRWAQQVDVERELLHLSIEELAQQIARSLSVQMHRLGGEAMARLSTSQVQSDDLAMQGWAVYFRGLTPDNLRDAAALFEQAVNKDEASIRGWGGVSTANGMAAYTHWATDRPAAISRLHQALARLHDLDADGLYAHVGRSLAALIDADWEAVLTINSEGLTRFPGHSPTHYARALALTRLGRFDECLVSAHQALKIGPRDHQAGAYHLQAGFCHFHLGQLPQAAERARLAQTLSPRLDLAPLLLASAQSLSGDALGAQQTMDGFRQRRPAFTAAHAARLLNGRNERFAQGREKFMLSLEGLGLR